MVIVVGLAVAVIVVVMIVMDVAVVAFSVGVLLVLLLDDLFATHMDFAVHVVGDDVIPVGKAVVEFLDVLFALGDLPFILLALALIFLFDALRLALRSGFGGSFLASSFLAACALAGLAGRIDLVGLVGGLARRAFGVALRAALGLALGVAFRFAGLVFLGGLGGKLPLSTGLAMASGLNSAMTSK